MKLKFFTLLLLAAACFVSCRKINNDPDIKQYDQQQIQSYIAANGLNGMVRDTTMGDTTGTYYQIINPGNTAKPIDYPSTIAYVYTFRTFDGKFSVTDTALNHFYGVLGHVVPKGLMLAIRNNLKFNGGKMRVLVPSHLAYGKNGTAGAGSITLTNGHIGGNQCLDITVNMITDQAAYDQLVIKNYMAANNLTGYTQTADGLWYKITTAPTGTNYFNINTSTVTMNYSIYLMNNTNPDGNTYAKTVATFNDFAAGAYVPGFVEGLKILGKGTGGISIIVPSALAYGGAGGNGIPANECLRWDMTNITVTNQ